MSDISYWKYVDVFTIHQAACLWGGMDPARNSKWSSTLSSQVIAIKQMLVGAAISGELNADSSRNYSASIGDLSDSLVSRADLIEFARQKELFPAFLFDTFLTEHIGIAESISPNKDPLDELLDTLTKVPFTPPPPRAEPINNKNPKSLPAPKPNEKNRGGRPQEYDWDSFTMEIVRLANGLDGLPDKQADLIRMMLQWFTDTYGAEPAESSVKERVSKIYNYLEKAKNPSG
ncbi:hypothetical protein H2509_07780 [Stappia sp. F7233]|uniref:Uncharacterized protein n=1 Tax=Stappia albiluteola TaxID=2758565 RepID=A0A839AEM0_9HYPH|nr:hypothetical protein [Stappia albiluteola]MBA5777029.1 hypothetical protein [Stappia albiluteola]